MGIKYFHDVLGVVRFGGSRELLAWAPHVGAMTPAESRVRSRVFDTHRETLRSLIDTGRRVAGAWPGRTATEASAVRDPLEHLIEGRGLNGALLEMLRVGVDALGTEAKGTPLPSPPYVLVTSRGPICRVTVADGRRLVMVVELFEVDRTEPSYRFVDPQPDDCLSVRIK